MTSLTPNQTAALAYWGNIENAVSQRLGTADLWSAIRAASGTEPGTPIGFNAADLSVLRGMAASIRNAATNLEAARGDYTVTADMVGRAPWARSQAEMNTLPIWQVRFQHTTTDVSGNELTDWRTSVFTGQIPDTVGGILDAVDQDALGIAEDYGRQHVSVGSLQIIAV
jgi:hypothetical protein